MSIITIGTPSIEFSKSSEEILVVEKQTRKIAVLNCKDYGFDCNFSSSSSEIIQAIREFQEHTLEAHYIDYPEGVLMRFITDKRSKVEVLEHSIP